MSAQSKRTGAPESFAARWRGRLAALSRHRTLQIALVGTLLYWASLPPLAWWPLGWVAAVPWLLLVRLDSLPGRRPYGAIYLAGIVFWLATNHWMRLPHWTTGICWVALAFYIGCYIPLTVGLARIAVHRFGVSVVVAGPIMWAACDQARAVVMTGFPLSSLCHGQYRQVELIQAADLCGEFGVTFLMVLAAAGIARAWPIAERHIAWPWLLVTPAVVAATYAYGSWQLRNEVTTPGPTIALIQDSIDSQFKYEEGAGPKIYDRYMKLSHQALRENPNAALVVWPETMFPYPQWTVTDDAVIPPQVPFTIDELRQRAYYYRMKVLETVNGSDALRRVAPNFVEDDREIIGLDRPMLLGVAAADFDAAGLHSYNSVLYVDRRGVPHQRYDKQHRVVFGEFIPLADWLPFLYKLSPLTGGIEEGRSPVAVEAAGVRLSPSVCYESVIGRLIRGHVVELARRGEEPDVLVNVTNDGWFWGSSELDLHLACGVFRAVECRKPLVIAANTGFSAHVDSSGRIVKQGPRRAPGVINAEVRLDSRRSGYVAWGDRPVNFCVLLAIVALIGELIQRRRTRSQARQSLAGFMEKPA